jgi:hypothetical protein
LAQEKPTWSQISQNLIQSTRDGQATLHASPLFLFHFSKHYSGTLIKTILYQSSYDQTYCCSPFQPFPVAFQLANVMDVSPNDAGMLLNYIPQI